MQICRTLLWPTMPTFSILVIPPKDCLTDYECFRINFSNLLWDTTEPAHGGIFPNFYNNNFFIPARCIYIISIYYNHNIHMLICTCRYMYVYNMDVYDGMYYLCLAMHRLTWTQLLSDEGVYHQLLIGWIKVPLWVHEKLGMSATQRRLVSIWYIKCMQLFVPELILFK